MRKGGRASADILARFPKQRPVLPESIASIYNIIYEQNREGKTAASSITRKMESWLHRKVAADVSASDYKYDTLEIGAGTLNQLDYEKATGRYDIVEPFKELYESSPNLRKVDDFYDNISDVLGCRVYDRITSVATFEHICELPEVIAKAGILLKNDGVLRVAIPSEGTFLWTLGWKLTTGLEFKLKHGLDWGDLMAHEHVNTALEIDVLLNYFFNDVRSSVFGLTKSFSFYQYYESRNPKLDRCNNFEIKASSPL